MKKAGLMAACTLLSLICSCSKDGTIAYNDIAAGSTLSGTFLSDAGLTYNIVEQTCEGNIYGLERVLMTCDILRHTSGKPDSYDVRLKSFRIPLLREAGPVSEMTEHDPVKVLSCWSSGNFLNFHYVISQMQVRADDGSFKPSTVVHDLNLYKTMVSDTLNMYLDHNGFGEVYGVTGDIDKQQSEDYKVVLAEGYLSVQMSSVMPPEAEQIPVKLHYKFYKHSSDGYILPTSEWIISKFSLKKP